LIAADAEVIQRDETTVGAAAVVAPRTSGWFGWRSAAPPAVSQATPSVVEEVAHEVSQQEVNADVAADEIPSVSGAVTAVDEMIADQTEALVAAPQTVIPEDEVGTINQRPERPEQAFSDHLPRILGDMDMAGHSNSSETSAVQQQQQQQQPPPAGEDVLETTSIAEVRWREVKGGKCCSLVW